MRTKIWLVGFGLIVAAVAGAAAQQGASLWVPPNSAVKFSRAVLPTSGETATRIIGTVVDVRQMPVARAKVVLRDLNTGQVVGEDETDENGEYHFDTIAPGTYVVEMVLSGGSVAALSNAGSLARYETLQTVIQLQGRWDPAARNVVMETDMIAFVGVSSATTMTAETLSIAANQNIAPVDAGEPVSP